MKVELPELERVFSQVLQNVAIRVRFGFENYWARRRAGLKADAPHFRRVRNYSSLTYPQFGFKLDGSRARPIGWNSYRGSEELQEVGG